MEKRKLRILIVMFFVLLYFVSILISKNSNTVKIGVLTPLSGFNSKIGENQRNAISMAINDLKEKGVNMDRYKIIYQDSINDTNKSPLSGYESLKSKGVKIIITDGDNTIDLIKAKAESDKILVISQSSKTPDFIDYSQYSCTLGINSKILGSNISALSYGNLNAKGIIILASNSSYAQGIKDQIIKTYAGRVYEVESFDSVFLVDLSEKLTKIMQNISYADAMIVIDDINPDKVFEKINEMSLNKNIISDVWTINNTNSNSRSNLKNIKFIDYEFSEQLNLNKNPLASEFINKYKSKFNKNPDLLSALTYDSFNVLYSTIDKVGPKPLSLSMELLNTHNYKGVTGTVDFDTSCQSVNKETVIRKIKNDGTFENL